jgi:hypothetical protein
VRIISNEFGGDLRNGTYTDAVVELQNGDFDTITSYVGQTADMYEQFICAMFDKTRFAMLMKRQQDFIEINTNGLMAGINIGVYCLIFAALCILAMTMLVHETRQREKNSLWHILNTLMPSNTSSLKYQNGFTRRMIILTCGITIFLSTTYYQSNLLQMLLIPDKPPKFSIEDVTRNVETFRSKLYTWSAMQSFLDSSKLSQLKNAMTINPPDTIMTADLRKNIVNENGILLDDIDIIMQRLSQLPPNECANYVVIDVPDILPMWMGLVLRNERRDLLEPINFIIAERMDFINNLLNKPHISKECHNHIYPPDNAETRFIPLSMYSLSGAFAVLVCLLILSVLTFVAEIISRKTCLLDKKNEVIVMDDDVLHLVDHFIYDKIHQHIKGEHECNVFEKYSAFREAFSQGTK